MQTNNVVVIYTIKPEAKVEHIKLIEAVFDQLEKDKLSNVDYQVMCLTDGISFIHISTSETADGSNPIPELAAFKEFGSNLSERVATPPKPSAATTIGSYSGRV